MPSGTDPSVEAMSPKAREKSSVVRRSLVRMCQHCLAISKGGMAARKESNSSLRNSEKEGRAGGPGFASTSPSATKLRIQGDIW